MASWLPSFDFSSSYSSLGRNILVGVSIGLGIGIGVGAGIAASRKMLPVQAQDHAQDQRLVSRFVELTNEIRELRCVMVRLEVFFHECGTNLRRTVPLNDQSAVQGSGDEASEEDDEFYEMSGEELSSRFVFFLVVIILFPSLCNETYISAAW